jgi:hypothetical protein
VNTTATASGTERDIPVVSDAKYAPVSVKSGSSYTVPPAPPKK